MLDQVIGFERLLDEFVRLETHAEKDDFFIQHPLFEQILQFPHLPAMEREAFLHRHPMLFSTSILSLLLQIEHYAQALIPHLNRFGVSLSDSPQGTVIMTNVKRYPVGRGPIEQLWERVKDGSTPLTEAIKEAIDPSITCLLSPLYISALSARCEALQHKHPMTAASRQRLVMEAGWALDDSQALVSADDVWKIRKWTGVSWVEVATYAVLQIPDGRIFNHALEIGERLIDESENLHNDEEFLGRILERVGVLYLDPFIGKRNLSNYDAALSEWKDKLHSEFGDEARTIENEWPLPDPQQALQNAVRHLTRAAEFRTGREKGLTLKALAQAINAQIELGFEQDDNHLRRACQEAITILNSGPVWSKFGDFRRIIELKAIVAKLNARNFSSERKRAKNMTNFESPSNKQRRVDETEGRSPEEEMKTHFNALEGLIRKGKRDQAINCLERIVALSKVPAPGVMEVLAQGLFKNALPLEAEFGDAAVELVQSACRFAIATSKEIDLDGTTIFLLFQVAKGLRFATALSAGLSEISHMDSTDWSELDRVLERLTQFEIAEGEEDNAARYNLSLVAYAAQDEITGDDVPESKKLKRSYDRKLEHLLISLTDKSRELPFHIPPLIPLMKDRDSSINVGISEYKDVRQLIDDRTVLVTFFLGHDLEGYVSISLIMITSEDVRFAQIKLQDTIELRIKISSEILHPIAFFVERVRNEILKNPENDQVASAAALDILEANTDMFFGGFTQLLDQFRTEGKDHLCIVPHGPLHFFPFHLLGDRSRPLGAEWIITYLPNLYLLGLPSRRTKSMFERSDSVAAFAVDKFHSKSLPPLPEATNEATKIAEVFGTSPIINEEFGMSTFVAHLVSGHKYIHIATHGVMDIDAPSFHRLWMGPKDGSDQEFYAFQLLSLDLRGVELLTLGACETALGRFDRGDNLRGLPANFLRAGVSAMVGTLWEVESSAAETFFTKLYDELKNGAERLDAFAHAQSATREMHPEYRDWGAFFYMGNWGVENTENAEITVPGIPWMKLSPGMRFTPGKNGGLVWPPEDD